jgi:hypothetical protein
LHAHTAFRTLLAAPAALTWASKREWAAYSATGPPETIDRPALFPGPQPAAIENTRQMPEFGRLTERKRPDRTPLRGALPRAVPSHRRLGWGLSQERARWSTGAPLGNQARRASPRQPREPTPVKLRRPCAHARAVERVAQLDTASCVAAVTRTVEVGRCARLTVALRDTASKALQSLVTSAMKVSPYFFASRISPQTSESLSRSRLCELLTSNWRARALEAR